MLHETRRSGVYNEGKPTQMATLNDMLLVELIKIGDTIEFTIKGNIFTAKILRGGLIGKCQQQSIHDKEPVSVLETKEHKTINNILHESYEETSTFISCLQAASRLRDHVLHESYLRYYGD